MSSPDPPPLTLFVCRLNTATSIMAEAILRHWAQGRLRAASAGELVGQPVSRRALQCLRTNGISTAGLRPRLWGEFFGLERQPVRFLIAFSDVYAARANWPPETLISRWDMPDPATVTGPEPEIQAAFQKTFDTLSARVQHFLALPFARLGDRALGQEIARIGGLP